MTETTIDFAKENGYPIEELNKSQKEKIKLRLDRALLKEGRRVAETIFSWKLKDKTLEVCLKDHLESHLSQM